MSRTQAATGFLREAHDLVRDLFEPDPRRYWMDFLLTIAIAYGALAVYLAVDVSALGMIALVVSALAMFRAAVFIHEITHRPAGSFTAFTVGWNALCGIPFCMPSFLYGDHHGHHTTRAYGTRGDPEYILLPSWRRGRYIVFLALALVYPILGPIRFLVLTPLALIVRPLDRLIWTWASSLYNMNEFYRRPDYVEASTRSRWIQELVTSAWAWAILALALTDRIAWATLGKVYVVFALWMMINQIRTLAAHRYTNPSGRPVSHLEQMLDTNTFTRGRILPHLWAPLGLRYHALHHLFPALPYHAMGAAHRRLRSRLSPDSPYHATFERTLAGVLAERLLRRSSEGPEARRGCRR
jgi:fatty acid desaturase